MSELDAVRSVLRRQRAHRSFTDAPVSEEVITDILELATRAPSAQNSQPWECVVVQDPDRRAAMWELASRLWDMGAKAATDGWERTSRLARYRAWAAIKKARSTPFSAK